MIGFSQRIVCLVYEKYKEYDVSQIKLVAKFAYRIPHSVHIVLNNDRH